MLLSIAADPRLVVARLAAELVQLRHARELAEPQRQRLALEAREIYAPLSSRLGVWSLKWELEDLAFRQLEPHEYRHIAAALVERRVARELYVEQACAQLQEELAGAGIVAQVYGRPKHIYSIWRKMQRKQLAFEELYDVRAVRVVVADRRRLLRGARHRARPVAHPARANSTTTSPRRRRTSTAPSTPR